MIVITSYSIHYTKLYDERLAGLTLGEIRRTVRDRLRDVGPSVQDVELLNVFVTQSDELFDLDPEGARVMLGSAQPLADQPEFATNTRMRELLELTERRDVLRKALEQHKKRGRITSYNVCYTKLLRMGSSAERIMKNHGYKFFIDNE